MVVGEAGSYNHHHQYSGTIAPSSQQSPPHPTPLFPLFPHPHQKLSFSYHFYLLTSLFFSILSFRLLLLMHFFPRPSSSHLSHFPSSSSSSSHPLPPPNMFSSPFPFPLPHPTPFPSHHSLPLPLLSTMPKFAGVGGNGFWEVCVHEFVGGGRGCGRPGSAAPKYTSGLSLTGPLLTPGLTPPFTLYGERPLTEEGGWGGGNDNLLGGKLRW